MEIVILLRIQFMAVISIKHNDKYEDIILEFGRIFSFHFFIKLYEISLECSVLSNIWVNIKTKNAYKNTLY